MMSKEIKNYLHLYLGCEVMGIEPAWDESRKGYLTGINGEYEAEIQFFEEDGVNVSESPAYNKFTQVKPILRPLSSMTEAEMKECVLVNYNMRNTLKTVAMDFRGIMLDFRACNAPTFHWLLSKHFDLFGLIEAGLAIDSTTL